MSAKAINEYTGKVLLSKFLKSPSFIKTQYASVTVEDGSTLDSQFDELPKAHEWLLNKKLVVKVDQLVKRRGKQGLLAVDISYEQAKNWIKEKSSKEFVIGHTTGKFDSFIIEPFLKHTSSDEYYLSIISTRAGNLLMFYEHGGIDVGDVDSLARKIEIPIGNTPTTTEIIPLLEKIPKERKEPLGNFIIELFTHYDNLNFTYLEINPLVMINNDIYILDLAAKLDETAEFECSVQWGPINFPPPFGRSKTKEETYIAELDSKSGASLKLTILNPEGRIWTMVAGGGASVIYSDTICDLGGAKELANYGEYSGAPTEGQTYEYAKTILTLMTKQPHPQGKLLLIGGGIANFTNVATTFKGIERALKEYSEVLKEQKVKIYVRRGGPNYEEGLSLLRNLGENLGIPIEVFGPDSHMTSIVALSLGIADKKVDTNLNIGISTPVSPTQKESHTIPTDYFTPNTRSIIFGLQTAAVQRMLDFDHACRREKPSVAAMVYPFTENHMEKFYWGRMEFLLPCYKSIREAAENNSDSSVFINFSSFRSAFQVTMEAFEFPQFRVIAIIAEGIPEKRTKILIKKASEKNVLIIGPATVGGIKGGCFRIGNTGGSMDNIIASKLYRPGSVAYVSKSGGMSNELNNIISRTTDGIYEGVAIGGDRYPGSTFLDHLLRFQSDPNVKLLVLLGEVGGIEEYSVCKAIQEERITKPLVAWCIGTCGSMFNSEVQFGHAGAFAQGEAETARAKNIALKNAGAVVPNSFNELGNMISAVYQHLVQKGIIIPRKEPEVPKVPIDYSWAQELGLIRKPTSFISTISDERGDELTYNGIPVSTVLEEDLGIGGVLGLLWFKRRLPNWACKFIETCLIITADHGPAVSGAHNTIVAARAGKDLVSSLASGLLTIGDRFGGALDAAAQQFTEGFDKGFTPAQFVENLRRENKLIMGIGHRVKSVNNPDKRVELIKEFAKKNFTQTPLLNFALQVETLTVAKKPNLILNVDGAIACCFVDLLRNCGCFTETEAKEYIQLGFLNGLFVLGRTIGFVGHYLDQKRLKQGLYRHSWDDISYVLPENAQFS